MGRQLVNFRSEFSDVFELSIHTCKPHICDGIDPPKVFHDAFAHRFRSDFFLAEVDEFPLDGFDELFESGKRNRALVARASKS